MPDPPEPKFIQAATARINWENGQNCRVEYNIDGALDLRGPPTSANYDKNMPRKATLLYYLDNLPHPSSAATGSQTERYPRLARITLKGFRNAGATVMGVKAKIADLETIDLDKEGIHEKEDFVFDPRKEKLQMLKVSSATDLGGISIELTDFRTQHDYCRFKSLEIQWQWIEETSDA